MIGSIMTLGARLSLAAVCLAGSALITWAIYDPALMRERDAPAVVRERVESAAPGATSTLWILAIGVSKYEEPALALEFADADAREIARTLRTAARSGRYREVKSLVLIDREVTRASLLDGLANFLGQAGPDDVAVLFFAGHGVRDLSSGSYYFLPHPARPDNLLTEGLRMTDFDEMLRIVRRNVRAVVVMLDTCHAGAMGTSSSGGSSGGIVSADEMAAQMSAGEGFFLLAASRPGEESKEERGLGHGAFTFSILEGLDGRADGDGDGALSVSELFGYVAKRVPALTGGQQHPYHKTEGTDLILVSSGSKQLLGAAARGAATASPPGDDLPTPLQGAERSNSIAVLEFENLRADRKFDWISRALRVAFDTELSKVKALRVFSPELIDHTSRVRGADSLYTARELGVGRLVTGAYHVTGETLRIDARIVDAGSGVNEASDSVEGQLDEFFDLQKSLVLSMLRRLRVQVSAAEGESIQTETNTDVDAYRLLLESEGLLAPPANAAAPSPTSGRDNLGGWLDLFAAPVYADDLHTAATADLGRVDEFLERLRTALEAKDAARVAENYVSFSTRQQQALQAYLDAAENLAIEFVDVDTASEGPDLVVSFTRRDRFDDRKTGRQVRLEVRLSKVLVETDGQLKIGPIAPKQ
jgi:TolB-like protein